MPFSSIADLKMSPVYKTNVALQAMSEQRLERFLAVFNATHARILRNGGPEDVAEQAAFRLAFGIASKASFAPPSAKAESKVHYFAPMMPQMENAAAGGRDQGEYSFDIILSDPPLRRAIAAGNVYNMDHDRGEPVGVILDLIPMAEVPEEVRAAADPDAPFLVAASYFEGTPTDIRSIETISAEWVPLDVGRQDGKKEALPFSFGVTRVPINDKTMGVVRVASENCEIRSNLYKVATEDVRHSMSPEPNGASTLEEKVASMAKLLEEKDSELKASKAEAAKATAATDEFMAKIASLFGKPAESADISPEKVASLVKTIAGKNEELSTKVAALEKERAEARANEFAQGLVDGALIATDASSIWASNYLKDPEGTIGLSKTLQASGLVAGEAHSERRTAEEEKGYEVLRAAVDSALGIKAGA